MFKAREKLALTVEGETYHVISMGFEKTLIYFILLQFCRPCGENG